MGEKGSLYHLWFGQLAAERLPKGGSIEIEPQVSMGPLRADFLLLRKNGPAEGAGLLIRLWQMMPRHALIEYKSPGHPPGPDVFDQLLTYAHQIRRARWPAMGEASELAAVLVTSNITPSVRASARNLGLKRGNASGAYTRVRGPLFPTWIVSLDELAKEEHEPLLTFFARGNIDPSARAARRWMRTRMTTTDTTEISELEGYDDALKAIFRGLSLEDRLEGLTAEERLRGLPPEERLRGLPPEELLRVLPPEELLLSLPVEALRALAPAYVDSLPEPIRAEIRRRTSED